MLYFLENMCMIALPPQSATLFAMGFGTSIGLAVSTMKIVTVLVQRRLKIARDEPLKYSVLLVIVSLLTALLYFVVVTLVCPPYSVRAANFEYNLAALGYSLFFTATGLSMFVLSILTRCITNRIISSATEDSLSS